MGSFRLSPEAWRLLRLLTQDMGVSQSDVLEIVLRDLARSRKVGKSFPKDSNT